MNDAKTTFYKTLNIIVGTNRVDNEEAYIINDYISRLEATIKDEQQEIERLNNIIDEKDYKIKRLVYSCYESDMSYEEFKAIWVNAFEKLYDPKDIDKLENELKGDNK